jgi:hypothetical protein
MSNPIAGWYTNPTSTLEQRLWDGEQWTEEVRPLPPIETETMPPPTLTAARGVVSDRWWEEPAAFKSFGRSGKLMVTHSKYLGGWSSHPDTKAGSVIAIDQSGVGMRALKPTFTIPWDQIVEMAVEGPETAAKRVTATRVLALGVFALAAKKKSKMAVLSVTLLSGEEALFQTEQVTSLELQGKLASILSQVNRQSRQSR